MFKHLKSLRTDKLKSLDGFNGIDEAKLANATLRLDSGLTFATRFKHSFQVIDRAAGAASLLQRLPDQGESIHCILRGDFALFDFLPATIRLNQGKAIDKLKMATLGFSKKNVDALALLAADGLVKDVSVLCSHYFSSLDSDIFQHFITQLPAFKITAMRTHAKVMLMQTGGIYLTVESSANLRSCHNVEQATITNDAGLYSFHAKWIDELTAKASATK